MKFTDEESRIARLLLDMASHYEQLKNQEAEALIVEWPIPSRPTSIEQMQLPFPVLIDEKGELHSEMGATDKWGQCVMGLLYP